MATFDDHAKTTLTLYYIVDHRLTTVLSKASMKILLLLFSLSLSPAAFSQSQLDSIISANACNCLTRSATVDEETLATCILNAFKSDSERILKECLITYGDTSEASARKFGLEIYGRLSVSMIRTCDKYAQVIASIRDDSYRNINLDSIKSAYKVLISASPQKPSAETFTVEGIIHFKEGEFTAAISSFNKAIQQDSNAFQSIYFKAWALEKSGKFDEAISLYKQLSILTNRQEFILFATLAERNKKR
ncbi:MAG TPA: tetratricopeptide repeat protein [Niabella sp.]